MTISTINKVVCVGRNYAAHAKELGNDVPSMPLFFIKPASSVVYISESLTIAADFVDVPRQTVYDVHYEAELCLRLGKDLINATVEEVKDRLQHSLIDGITAGLDLTLRDLQSKLKAKAQPWERAKSFAGSCVLADWLDVEAGVDWQHITYQLLINDAICQTGDTANMIFDIPRLLSDASFAFGLQAGDVVMTGTPSGVGKLTAGDALTLKLGDAVWEVGVS